MISECGSPNSCSGARSASSTRRSSRSPPGWCSAACSSGEPRSAGADARRALDARRLRHAAAGLRRYAIRARSDPQPLLNSDGTYSFLDPAGHRGLRRFSLVAASRPARQAAAAAGGDQRDHGRCDHCGVNVPESEAVQVGARRSARSGIAGSPPANSARWLQPPPTRPPASAPGAGVAQLEYYALIRVLVASGLLLSLVALGAPFSWRSTSGEQNLPLILACSVVYFVLTGAQAVAAFYARRSFLLQVGGQLAVDLVIITLLIVFTGGFPRRDDDPLPAAARRRRPAPADDGGALRLFGGGAGPAGRWTAAHLATGECRSRRCSRPAGSAPRCWRSPRC